MRLQPIKLTERHRIELKDFKGIDVASAPSEVACNRATSMSNMVYDNGLVRKRHGWRQLTQIVDTRTKPNTLPRINGLFELELNGEKLRIAYAGNQFYLIINNQFKNVTTKRFNANGTLNGDVAFNGVDNLVDERCQAFIRDNKAYFVGCGDYVVLGKFSDAYEFRKVYNDESTTIPTTRIFINDNDKGKALDKPNILNIYRKNRLVGKNLSNVEAGATYQLDSAILSSADVRVKITTTGDLTINLHNNTSDDVVNRAVKLYDDLSSKDVTFDFVPLGTIASGELTIFHTNNGDEVYMTGVINVDSTTQKREVYYKPNGGEAILISTYTRNLVGQIIWDRWFASPATYTQKMGADAGYVDKMDSVLSHYGLVKASFPQNELLVDDVGKTMGKVQYLAGMITLNKELGNISPVIADDDNIEVTFATDLENRTELVARIREAKFGAVFGVGGLDDRVFLANGTNTDIYSESDDFSYFAEDSTITQGTAPIVGYLRLNDNALAVLKGDTTQDSTLYVRTGRYNDTFDNDGNLINSVPIFSTISANSSTRAVGNMSNVVLDNDAMFLAKEGVYGVELSTNINTNQRLVKLRSNTINKLLQEVDLTQAVGIVYDNKMYIASGSKCFVADARFKYRIKGDMTDTFNYEWWVWDNIPARVFAVSDNKLYFGTASGAICVFDNGYRDYSNSPMYSGAIVSNYRIQFNKAITPLIKKSSYLTFNTEVKYQIAKDNGYTATEDGTEWTITANDSAFPYFSDFRDVQVGDIVCNDISTDNYVLVKQVVSRKVIKCAFTNSNEIDTTKPLYLSLGTKKVQAVNIRESDSTFEIAYNGNNLSPLFIDKEFVGKFASIVVDEPVHAYWCTPITDLGGCDVLKDLVSITVAVDSTSTGLVEVSYHTRRDNQVAIPSTKVWETSDKDLSFRNFSFNHFSFIPSYDFAVRKPVMARHFNYIMLRLDDRTDKPFALKDILVEFKYINQFRGAR